MHLFLLLIFQFFITSPLPSNAQGDITLHVTGVNGKKGEVMAALFSTSQGFPYETSFAIQKQKAVAVKGVAEIKFTGVVPGTYAIALFHDTNGDGKLNTNFIGIPKEGYGVSNNKYNNFSAPGYKESSFVHNIQSELTVQMRY